GRRDGKGLSTRPARPMIIADFPLPARQTACSPVTGVSMASARKRPARFLFDRPKIKLIGKVVLPVFKRVVNWLKDERGDVPQNLVVVALWTAAGIVLVSLIGKALYSKANDLIEDISN